MHFHGMGPLKASVLCLVMGEADIWLSFFISVSRDGQHSSGTEEDFLQDHLLPDPERRATHRLYHHTDDHHVCRADQTGLEGRKTDDLKLERLINKWAASISAHSSLGWDSECKMNVFYKQNQMFKGKIILYVLTINLVDNYSI